MVLLHIHLEGLELLNRSRAAQIAVTAALDAALLKSSLMAPQVLIHTVPVRMRRAIRRAFIESELNTEAARP